MKKTGLQHRRLFTAGLGLTVLPGLGACAAAHRAGVAVPDSGNASDPDLAALIRRHALSYLLLGEVHDAQVQHRMRLRWLQALSGTLRHTGTPGKALRVILALEQLDAVQQPELDRFQASLSEAGRQSPATAKALARAAGFNFEAWDWGLYEPVIQLALSSGWRLVAANLAAAEAMRIARDPKAVVAHAELAWTRHDDQILRAEIQSGHCDALPAQAVAPMTRAQMARDERLAQAMHSALLAPSASAGRPVVILLTGNVHARRDIGAPRHLKALHPGAAMFSVGLLEGDGSEVVRGQAFDQIVWTAVQDREDPCIGFKARLGKPSGS